MNVVRCPSCGGRMKRDGTTSAGSTRWRCKACGASLVDGIDNSAKRLDEFLGWLLSEERQADMPGGGRTFRRRTAEFWRLWPLPPVTGEVCRVVFVDGIHLARKACVLICRSEEHVLGWYVSRSENSRSYGALMARIAPPEVVVTDGGPGFQKARGRLWPDTRVQRCTCQRVSSFGACDRILVLDAGRVAAFAPEAKLLVSCTIYQDVYEAQNRAGSEADFDAPGGSAFDPMSQRNDPAFADELR